MDLSRGVLLLLVAVLLLLSILFVLPFVQYFLLAVLLAYLLVPVQERLEKRVRPAVAAATVVAGASVAVILPLMYVITVTAAEAINLVESIRDGQVTFSGIEAEIQSLVGININIMSVLQSAVGDIQFDNVVGVFGAVTHVLIGLGLTLFLLYYFLKDRDEFLGWLRQTVPLSDDVQDRLYHDIDQTMSAVLIGHVLIALLQGGLAGIGLFATGVPNATFWTVVMVVLSLLPVVGSFLVWGPAVLYLFLNGQTAFAVALFVWGAVVVGVSDDYLRPIVVDRYARINPSVIIIGVVGGIYVIGVMGIFFGPVIIGALRATLDVFREEFGTAE